MSIQCPNPECNQRSIKRGEISIAVRSEMSHLWPIFFWSTFWRIMRAVAFLWLWMVLVFIIGEALSIAVVLFAGGELISLLLFLIYRRHYAPAEKINLIQYTCLTCRAFWIETDPVGARLLPWVKMELRYARRKGHKRHEAGALVSIGGCLLSQSDLDTASARTREGQTLFRELGDKRGTALGLLNLGVIALLQGENQQAEDYSTDSLQLSREIKDWQHISYALANLGLALIYQGQVEPAIPLLRESLELKQKMWNRNGLAWAFDGFAGVAQRRQQPEQAAQLYSAAYALRAEIQEEQIPNQMPGYIESVVALRTQLGEEAYAAASAQGRALSIEQAIALALPIA